MDPDILILSHNGEALATHYIEPLRGEPKTNPIISLIQPLLEPALANLPNITLIDCGIHSQSTVRNYCLQAFRNIRSGSWKKEPKLQRIIELLSACDWNVCVRAADGNRVEVRPKYGETGQVISSGAAVYSGIKAPTDAIPYSEKTFEAFLHIKELGFSPGEVLFTGISIDAVSHYNELDGGLANCLLVDRGPDTVAIIS